MNRRIVTAALAASLIAACADIVDAGFDGVLPGAPDAAAAGGHAAGGSGFDASAGAGASSGGATGNPGGAAGAAGTAPSDAADPTDSADRDASGDARVNSPPVAADGTLLLVEGTKKKAHLPSSDADGDVLVHRIVSPPIMGTITITNATTGEFEYASLAGRYGTDSFTYQVADLTSEAPLAGRIEVTVVALGSLRAEPGVVAITHHGFGRGVDIEGDTAVAGAWWWGSAQHGAAYVMRRDSLGSWKVTQEISEVDPVEQYGHQVALSGDWLIVTASAPYAADPRPGEAYFYKRQNKDGPFEFKHRFRSPSPATSDKYGSALSVDGDVAVIGARGEPGALIPDGGDDVALRGAAYIYRRNAADEWRLEKAIESPDGELGQHFGWGVGIYGDTLAVSGRLKQEPGKGPIHFFVRENGQWRFEKTSTPTSPGFSMVGESIAVHGDQMFVSNPGSEAEEGYARVYARDPDGWQVQPVVLGPQGAPLDFGYPVALLRDTAVIAAISPERSGAAYVYRYYRQTGFAQWAYAGRKLEPAERMEDEVDEFGYALAFDGTTAIVGAPSKWSDGRRGAVYFFGIAPPGD